MQGVLHGIRSMQSGFLREQSGNGAMGNGEGRRVREDRTTCVPTRRCLAQHEPHAMAIAVVDWIGTPIRCRRVELSR